MSLHSDQCCAFESDLMKELCKLLQIRKTRYSPSNPKCNGAVERFNKTLVCMILAFIKDEEAEWDLNLNLLAAAYRATPCESTGLSSNMVMLGREISVKLCSKHMEWLENTYNSADHHKCRYDTHTLLNQ